MAGTSACRQGLHGYPSPAVTVALRTQEAAARAWAELVRVLLQVNSKPKSATPAAAAAAAQASIAILSRLEETAAVLAGLRDVDGVHNCARLIWNVGLPLLQPQLRSHLKCAFIVAASALASVDSPLQRLQAQLLLEASKSHAADGATMEASVF